MPTRTGCHKLHFCTSPVEKNGRACFTVIHAAISSIFLTDENCSDQASVRTESPHRLASGYVHFKPISSPSPTPHSILKMFRFPYNSGPAFFFTMPGELAQWVVGTPLKGIPLPRWFALITATRRNGGCESHKRSPRSPHCRCHQLHLPLARSPGYLRPRQRHVA